MKITTGDIIAYLQQFPPDTETYLEHDGWDYYANGRTDKNSVIRDIFQKYTNEDKSICIFIQN